LEANSKQVEQNEQYLWNKEKKFEVTSAPPFDQPWFERFDNIFFGTVKINGIPTVIDQGVHVMNFETKVMNVSDEKNVQTPCVLSSPTTFNFN
jgi:hypothetical protein